MYVHQVNHVTTRIIVGQLRKCVQEQESETDQISTRTTDIQGHRAYFASIGGDYLDEIGVTAPKFIVE
jgi:hypothetical protein